MTSKPVFGDFLEAATRDLASADRRATANGGGDVQQVADSLLRVIVTMSHYVQDVTDGSGHTPARGRRR